MVPSESARDLDSALKTMTFRVLEGRFALAGLTRPIGPDLLEALATPPAQLVHEADVVTVLARQDVVEALVARDGAARIERDLAWIRFEAPMQWDVVGFLACVSAELAREGVPIGAVCGFHRDHVFVAARHLVAAERALTRLMSAAPRSVPAN